jgi:phage terminase Nu1 subunit (DNA packaging protein)
LKHCYDPSFKYVKAEEQGPDYLAKKFERIRRERLAREKAEREKVEREKAAQAKAAATNTIHLNIRRKEGHG